MFLRYKHGKSLWSNDGEGLYLGKYVGKVNDEEPNGKGECSYDKDRGNYKGSWRSGERHGKGTYKNLDGRKYVGEFKEVYITGQTKITFENGVKFNGNLSVGLPHGQGTMIYPDARIYIGNYFKGFKSGQGTLNYSDSSSYKGGYSEGERHGQGTYTSKNGSIYEGIWSDDRLKEGVKIFVSGLEIKGEFRNSSEVIVKYPEGYNKVWMCRGWTKVSYLYTNLPLSGPFNT